MEAVLESGLEENHESDNEDDTRPKSHKMTVWNELLLVLIKLRTGCSNIDLSVRFNIAEGTVSNKIITYVNLLYTTLGSLKIWPHRDILLKHAPTKFKKNYPNTVIIIDATELFVNVPSSLQKQSECYSHYKHHATLKGLLGVDPKGGVIFVLQLFEGSISGKELVNRSGFLNILKSKINCGEILKGDVIMADRGFLIEEELVAMGLQLNSPPVLREKGSFNVNDVIRIQTVAKHRIHIERAIGKIKCFRIFQSAIPIAMFGTINQIWSVICLLSNFQDPILTTNENMNEYVDFRVDTNRAN
ncbi:uncharacterized protein LOC117109097 isoform X1 [Anneissia japonica]|uniref:uncharacterized protein LOC117109097 isoform X1 n=1 Tax=Anneissia japonica TaxID=1529436 RepID=UPI0014259F7C|nr:uncharacterized protein LOC117109097 isoform X1 [Anneissia japonica]XP_033107230.1 uncharacterized protein LOC117109097 isoform X1 [Anneissia japonica]XP_033107231.1 uncharacterized protein LOC117109097 isoform X1 [Anneissia japonica]